MNYGSCVFSNCCFLNNRVKYFSISGDEAGAIKNLGLLYCINCTFQGNKGNLAGVIYSAYGAFANLTNCTFMDNVQCKGSDGGDFYNYEHANYMINGSNITKDSNLTGITIAYDYAPGPRSLKRIGYNLLKAISTTISLLAGFGGAAIAGPAGAWAGITLGTVLGIAIDLGSDLWFYNSIHEFTGFSVETICMSIFIHFQMAFMGGLIGMNIHITNYPEKYIKNFAYKGNGPSNTKVKITDYKVICPDSEEVTYIKVPNENLAEFQKFCNKYNFKITALNEFELPANINDIYDGIKQYTWNKNSVGTKKYTIRPYHYDDWDKISSPNRVLQIKVEMPNGIIKEYIVEDSKYNDFCKYTHKNHINFPNFQPNFQHAKIYFDDIMPSVDRLLHEKVPVPSQGEIGLEFIDYKDINEIKSFKQYGKVHPISMRTNGPIKGASYKVTFKDLKSSFIITREELEFYRVIDGV